MSTADLSWESLLAALTANHPITNHRLVVKRVVMADHGNTTLSGSEKTITITVRIQDPRVMQYDSLVHEWAHARTYDHYDWHGSEWGGYMGEAYKVLEKLRDG